MTISQSLKSAVAKLTARQLTATPHLEAEILLAKTLKKSRELILAHDKQKLTKAQSAAYKLKIKKRLTGLPIAYLTGEKEFYGLNFKVNKNVLIPRPETELMVEEALKLINHKSMSATLIDVGTGSGCIIITLAKQIKNYEFLATDISTKALAIAKQNAKAHHVYKKIKFLKGNLLDPIIHNSSASRRVIIHNSLIILANIPYLTPAQIKNSPTIKYEPSLALKAGLDGLKYYQQLFQQIKTLRDIYLLCEFDPRQTAKIKRLIKQKLPKNKLQIKKDLSGLNRLAIIKM